MPHLNISNYNIACATLGGFVTLFGLVSYLLKERYYLGEALISLLAGVIFSPPATNWIRPLDYALGSEENLATITLYFTRLVLGVQLVIAGVQLPSKYLYYEWKGVSLLLGPGMTGMWISSSLIVWAMVPNLSFLHALAVASCVTPTDPVLSNSIVKGKFADKNIPKELQKIIIAESGANDGLGYPFLFIALYLIKYVGSDGAGQPGGARLAMGYWFGETWGYTIILGTIYGAAVGWIAKELLHWAEERKYVDRESFLVFAIALAVIDWFRVETLDDSLQPTIDMLLNLSVFVWFGAVCPWASFANNDVIPIYRLIFLGILILLLRRIPVIYAMHWHIPQVRRIKECLFAGFFGPIGVSAIFYLYISLDFLRQVTVDGEIREDAARLSEVFTIVVWFMAICSIIVHGLSVPLGKIGYHLPRTLSKSTSLQADPEDPLPLEPFHVRDQIENATQILHKKQEQRNSRRLRGGPSRPIFRIGGSFIRSRTSDSGSASPSGVASIRRSDTLDPMSGIEKTSSTEPARNVQANGNAITPQSLDHIANENIDKELDGRTNER
ncbi:MAG: hypothetical protein Q9190_000582 [Brigantiaea leucoxantha]